MNIYLDNDYKLDVESKIDYYKLLKSNGTTTSNNEEYTITNINNNNVKVYNLENNVLIITASSSVIDSLHCLVDGVYQKEVKISSTAKKIIIDNGNNSDSEETNEE